MYSWIFDHAHTKIHVLAVIVNDKFDVALYLPYLLVYSYTILVLLSTPGAQKKGRLLCSLKIELCRKKGVYNIFKELNIPKLEKLNLIALQWEGSLFLMDWIGYRGRGA